MKEWKSKARKKKNIDLLMLKTINLNIFLGKIQWSSLKDSNMSGSIEQGCMIGIYKSAMLMDKVGKHF